MAHHSLRKSLQDSQPVYGRLTMVKAIWKFCMPSENAALIFLLRIHCSWMASRIFQRRQDIPELDNQKDSLFVFNLLRLTAFQFGNDISFSELA